MQTCIRWVGCHCFQAGLLCVMPQGEDCQAGHVAAGQNAAALNREAGDQPCAPSQRCLHTSHIAVWSTFKLSLLQGRHVPLFEKRGPSQGRSSECKQQQQARHGLVRNSGSVSLGHLACMCRDTCVAECPRKTASRQVCWMSCLKAN